MIRPACAMPKMSVLLTASFVLAAIGGLAPWSIFRITGDNRLTTGAFLLCAFVVGPAWALWHRFYFGVTEDVDFGF